MSRHEITEPMAVSFGITIAVPIEIFNFDTQRNIYECENYVIKKRDKAVDPIEKKTLDKCRAVIQWASACGASLVKAEKTIFKTIECSFSFDSLEFMLKFNKELNSRIEDFMIF